MPIEAMLASPPERDELVVQLFANDGGQFAEIYRDGRTYWIDLWPAEGPALRLPVDHLVESLNQSIAALRDRLENSPIDSTSTGE